jgi:HK97 family phage portal protein
MPIKIRAKSGKIWQEIQKNDISSLLNRPNVYQNRLQFIQFWVMSLQSRGNTYVLKRRTGTGKVTELHILDPDRVTPLVSTDGQIFYRLRQDNLAGLEQTDVTVPASEIIHDRINCLFHPLVGVSPIYSGGLAMNTGLQIQSDGYNFFANGAAPSGMLTAPGPISNDTAARLKANFEENYGGANKGKLAVAGDGLKYEGFRMTSVDAQLIDQLKWTADVVCSVFHVPAFKVGIGAMPTYQNAEVMNQIYYSDCLQSVIEGMEMSLKQGLSLPENEELHFDVKALLRMDTATQLKTLGEGVKSAIMSPNEARAEVNLPPVDGGESPLAQQQNYSLAALAKRDAKEDPFSTGVTSQPSADTSEEPDEEDDEIVRMAIDLLRKELAVET